MNITRTAVAAPLLVTILLLSACGGGSGGSVEDASASSADAGGATAPKSSDAVSGKVTDTARNAVTPMTRSTISTGAISLESRTISRARADVMRLTASWGGVVADEQTGSDRQGRLSDSTMTLRVPSARFDAAMNALAEVARARSQTRTSKDVSTQVIDNRARIRAAERSIQSIERLLGRATRLSDVIAIESDLARRQADLDSLQQQEAYLADQTSLSTITVSIGTPPRATPAPPDKDGFLAGLAAGWAALRTALVASLTVLGAMLPFGVVAAILGVPLWLVLRRRRLVTNPESPVSAT